jgi:phosphoglycerol transferase MdoB-like AlkP superfamily enzyme
MGFDDVAWLNETPGIERAAQGVWVSDRAVVESVIRASQQAYPFFIFAFPSSTHSPYHHSVYRKSELDVQGLPAGSISDEIKYYINALRVADQALEDLVEYFRGHPDPTVIAIMGDHLPPLTEGALRLFNEKLSTMPEAEKFLMSRRVPFLVWANFDIPKENIGLSVNGIPSYLLEKIGIPPHGFISVSDAVRRKLPILKRYVRRADGSTRDFNSLTGEERDLISDYWLLQHDLLNGEHYSIRGSTSDRMPAIR